MATAMAYGKDAANGAAAAGGAPPARKKLKTSDLPLASATRAAIEGLAHTFKKKGGYDSLRKQVWEDLEGSVSSVTFLWRKGLETDVFIRTSNRISRARYLMLRKRSLRKTRGPF
jgi:COMPASS (Complex proteins associated with Set1p) component shg1